MLSKQLILAVTLAASSTIGSSLQQFANLPIYREDYRCGPFYELAACHNPDDSCSNVGYCGQTDAHTAWSGRYVFHVDPLFDCRKNGCDHVLDTCCDQLSGYCSYEPDSNGIDSDGLCIDLSVNQNVNESVVGGSLPPSTAAVTTAPATTDPASSEPASTEPASTASVTTAPASSTSAPTSAPAGTTSAPTQPSNRIEVTQPPVEDNDDSDDNQQDRDTIDNLVNDNDQSSAFTSLFGKEQASYALSTTVFALLATFFYY